MTGPSFVYDVRRDRAVVLGMEDRLDTIRRKNGREEWLCEHGVGHTVSVPIQYAAEPTWWVHGCDGCCPSFQKDGGLGPWRKAKNTPYTTGSVRSDRTGKGRFDLLPAYAVAELARHYETGSAIYGDRNWQKGQPLSRFLDSALRHIFQWMDGRRDEKHLVAAAWNLLGLIWTEREIAEGRLPKELAE